MNKIPFNRAFQSCKNGEKIPFFIEKDAIKFEGVLAYDSSHREFIKLCGTIRGTIELICDLSGESYNERLNEDLEFYLSNGQIDLDSEHFEDIVECENGQIDLEEILRSELEMIRCDYHIKE